MTPQEQIQAVLSGALKWALITGKWQDFASELPDKCVDHVITDPPYDARTHKGARCGPGAPVGVSFASLVDAPELVRFILRVSRRWGLAFCTFEMIADYMRAAGPAWVRTGVWDRVNPSPQLTGDRPSQAADAIAIMHSSEAMKRWNAHGKPAIWRYSAHQGKEKPEHDTPKPLPLMLELVEQFTDRDEIVLDTHCGSGTTVIACLRLGRRVIGIDEDPAAIRESEMRIAAESEGSTLSARRANQIPLFGGTK